MYSGEAEVSKTSNTASTNDALGKIGTDSFIIKIVGQLKSKAVNKRHRRRISPFTFYVPSVVTSIALVVLFLLSVLGLIWCFYRKVKRRSSVLYEWLGACITHVAGRKTVATKLNLQLKSPPVVSSSFNKHFI